MARASYHYCNWPLAKILGVVFVVDATVTFGRRFDVARLLAAADIYCLPSVAGEFFPNSIVEAMAMGKPWVGSNIAELNELTAGGDVGLLVEIGDVDGLARGIYELASNDRLRAAMGSRARVEVEQRFTIGQAIDRVVSACAKSVAVTTG